MLKLFDWKYLIVVLYCCVIAVPVVRAGDAEDDIDSEPLSESVSDKPAEKDPEISDEKDSGKAPETDLTDKSELPYWKKSAYWLERSRDTWSERVDWMARGIDQFFAGEDSLASGNKSFVRFRAGGAWVEGEGYVDNTDIKFRLHLPATKRRFHIIIENTLDDKESLEEKSRPSLSESNGIDDSSVTAAIEFARSEAKHWKTKALLGVKARLPGDMFVKFSAKRRWELNDLWTMPYRFKAAEYLNDDWEIEQSLAFERPLENELFFSATSSIEWKEDEATVGAQIFSLRKRLSDRKGVDYRLGVIGSDVANPRVSSYFIGVHYRELLYKDWLYWNVIPEVNYPRDQGFESVFSFTVRFEVFFQK